MSKKLTKSVNSALTSIASRLQTGRNINKSSPSRSQRRRRSRAFFYRPRTVNSTMARSLPAAYASHVRPRFNVLSRGINSVRVSGCDLIYPISDAISPASGGVFSVIPANPAYWTGTKIGQFAPAYMNYRPLALTFSYIPQVAVTQAGTVFMGTLWNGAPSSDDIQQSLFTSNGGCLTQCYVPCDTTITLGTNLPQNLFTLAGALSTETNPFIFVAGATPNSVVPGYFYVTYTYEFKNPIGTSWKFYRSVPQLLGDKPGTSDGDTSLVILSRPRDPRTFVPSGIPIGTIMDVEADGVYYAGTKMTLSSDTIVIYFSCTNLIEVTYPLPASADAIMLSHDEFLTTSSDDKIVPLSQLQSVTTPTSISALTHEGTTYDKLLVLSEERDGVQMKTFDVSSTPHIVEPRQKFAYLKTDPSKPTLWGRIWDTTKKVVLGSAVGLLAAGAVGAAGYTITRRLFPNKVFSQAAQTPAFINLQAPQSKEMTEPEISTSELSPLPASSSSSSSSDLE